jgi:hypothetical protein
MATVSEKKRTYFFFIIYSRVSVLVSNSDSVFTGSRDSLINTLEIHLKMVNQIVKRIHDAKIQNGRRFKRKKEREYKTLS